jgi:HNH endonuclease
VRKMQNLLKRFEAKVNKTADSCWYFTGCPSMVYPWFWLDGKNVHAHRVAYELYVGEIPQGLNVLHKCNTPRCVNPDHLYTGTQAENIQQCVTDGRHFARCRDTYML